MSKEQKEVTDQKALRKEVASRISFALDHMKALLGEKKFKNRVKKAAKLLTEGLGEKPQTEKKEEAPKAAPQKTAAPAAKKESAPAKKAAAPAKKASSPAKKATAPAKKTAAKKAAVKK